MVLAKPIELRSQIAGAPTKIFDRIIAVHAQRACGVRHELGQTIGEFGRIDFGLVLAFSDDQRVEQADRNAKLAGNAAHHCKITAATLFAGKAK